MEDDCFETLYKKTGGIPILILLAIQKLKDIPTEEYSEFARNLPDRNIDGYLMEIVHEILDLDEQIMLEVLSVLRMPEPLERISFLCTSVDSESALSKLENRSLIMRDISDGYLLHETVRNLCLDFMRKRHPNFLCKLYWKAYEMYHEDFEGG